MAQPAERPELDDTPSPLGSRDYVIQSNRSLNGLDHRRDSLSFIKGLLVGIALGSFIWFVLLVSVYTILVGLTS